MLGTAVTMKSTLSRVLSKYNTYQCMLINGTSVIYLCSWRWFCCFWAEEPLTSQKGKAGNILKESKSK